MTYFQSKEKPVFLHFLNREAANATDSSRSWSNDLTMLDVITLTHCSTMTVNISQMLEYTIEKPQLVEPLLKLSASNILITTSNNKDQSEFIASRQKLYEKVSDRYPIYFQDISVVEKFQIRQKNEFSMTRVLRRDLMEVTDRDFRGLEFYGAQRHGHSEDWALVVDNIDPIQQAFGRDRNAAITRASLEESIGAGDIPNRALDAFARIISARYFDHYKLHKEAVTCTGIGDVGFLDDYEMFPHYDLPILKTVLDAVSWGALKDAFPDLRDQVYDAYGGRLHLGFVECVQSFVGATNASVRHRSNYPEGSNDYYASLREQVRTYCKSMIYQIYDGKMPSFSNVEDYFEWSTGLIQDVIEANKDTDGVLLESWEKSMASKEKVRIVLLTATDTEDDAVVNALINAGYAEAGEIRTSRGIYSRFLHGRHKEVILARSSAGSVGLSGSEIVASEVLRELEPDHVIAVGICFGMKPSEDEQDKLGASNKTKGEQTLGDILYSEKITDYETVRLSFEDGEEDVRERGLRVPAGSILLDAARITRRKYASGNTKVFPGELISGLKLLDSQPALEDLRRRFPDAVGGEMEAVGVVAASLRHGVDWIVVKAICDWGMNKGQKEQQLAADNAAVFVVKMINVVQSAMR